MDPKKFADELDKEQRKISATLSYNTHYFTEFKRLCEERGWKYGESLDKLIKDFVHKFNPKFK